ncbi:MAG: hypothetical protein Q4A75_04325, partial [Peptostreptococcaceae bacterium]|nr:hypothetical protein [Peptostreptococcaceae bacterium]
NINFTDGKTFVKSERNGQYIEMSLSGNLHGHGLSNSSEMRVSSDNIYLINVNNRLHLAETEKRMEEFRGIDIYSNLVKMSPQLGEIKPNEPFVSVYDENANMQNARILKKPKTTLKRIEEGTARVYSTANEVEILGPKKNKYGSSDVYEKKQLKDFFNDETVAENYIGPLSAAPPGGGPINLDGIKGMIENITSTTKNILDGIAKIPSYLAKIYDFVATMFDVSEFQLDLTPLKIRLIDRFPFCIPSDFLNGIKLFNASVSEPKFNVKLETQYLTVNETIDGSILHYVRGFFRYVAVAWYSIFLIMRTRSMIKW